MANGIGDRAMGILGALGGGIQNVGSAIGQLGGSLFRNLQQRPELVDVATMAIEGLQQRPNVPLMQMAQARMQQRQAQQQALVERQQTAQRLQTQLRALQGISNNSPQANAILRGAASGAIPIEDAFEAMREVGTYRILSTDEILARNLAGNEEEISGVWQLNTTTGEVEQIDKGPLIQQMNDAGVVGTDYSIAKDRLDELAPQAQAAYNLNTNLVKLADYALENIVSLGPQADVVLAMKQGLIGLVQGLGLGDDVDLTTELMETGDLETMQSLIQTTLFEKVQALGGARGITDVEFKNLAQTVPQLSQNPYAFFQILNDMIQKNNQDISQFHQIRDDVYSAEQQAGLNPFRMTSFDAFQPVPFDINTYLPQNGPRRTEDSSINANAINAPFTFRGINLPGR
jgi:hypothetical protein